MAKTGKYKQQVLTMSVPDAVSSGYSDIGDLADEMGEWRDNLEEKFSQTQKYSDVSDAADMLEEHRDEVEVPDLVSEKFKEEKVTVSIAVPRSKRQSCSRATRLDNALSHLQAVIAMLEEKEEDESLPQDLRDECESLRDDLTATVDALDGSVEFPGMFG